MKRELTFLERLAEVMQRGLPLVERPYGAVATELGCAEERVLEGVQKLLADGIIKSIGAFVDYYRLGFQGFLFGMEVPPEETDDVAAALSAHSSVTHNYLREGDVNLWLTAIFPGQAEREKFLDDVMERMGYPYIALFGTNRLKLRPYFTFEAHERPEGEPFCDEVDEPGREWNGSMSEDELAMLSAVQERFPVSQRPFAQVATGIGGTERELLQTLRKLREHRVLRRIGGALDHKKVGYSSNALVAWQTDNSEESGMRAALYPWISHCYVRAVVRKTLRREWPFDLYTMIHARDDISFVLRLSMARKAIWPEDELVMKTLKEYKKSRYLI